MSTLLAAAPLARALARGAGQVFERWDMAERLIEHGWVPHHTTPFEMAVEHLDDVEALRRELLAYYGESWCDTKAKIVARLSSYRIDDEAKATLREALDAHEIAHYRSVCRLLFPEIERLFRTTLIGGGPGRVSHGDFVKLLVGERKNDDGQGGRASDRSLSLDDFLTGGAHEFALFKYLTADVGKHRDKVRRMTSTPGEYVPSLFVHISDMNIDAARRSSIPTRHAVVHGLVSYSTQQSSLNTIFIADYIFSIISQVDEDMLSSVPTD